MLELNPQQTAEWIQARVGKVTASRVADIIGLDSRGNYRAGRQNYMAEKVVELMTGLPYESGFQSKEMRRGTEVEPEARSAYEALRGVLVDTVGFVDHPTVERFGASPDGLVDDDGLIEIKCPNTWNHFQTRLYHKIDGGYMTQMQCQLACTGRAWCDYVSYDDRVKEELRLCVIRVERDEEAIKKIIAEVLSFNRDVLTLVAKLEAAA